MLTQLDEEKGLIGQNRSLFGTEKILNRLCEKKRCMLVSGLFRIPRAYELLEWGFLGPGGSDAD